MLDLICNEALLAGCTNFPRVVVVRPRITLILNFLQFTVDRVVATVREDQDLQPGLPLQMCQSLLYQNRRQLTAFN